MEFIKAVDTSELPAGKMVKVVVSSKEVLIANVAGTYFAIDNRCNHAGGSLADGKLNGSTVTCPKHGAQHDVKTGKAIGDAKIAFLKVKVHDEVSYQVKVEGTTILVGIP